MKFFIILFTLSLYPQDRQSHKAYNLASIKEKGILLKKYENQYDGDSFNFVIQTKTDIVAVRTIPKYIFEIVNPLDTIK